MPRVSHNVAHVWVDILVCVHFICTLYTASYSTWLAHDTGLHTVSILCGPSRLPDPLFKTRLHLPPLGMCTCIFSKQQAGGLLWIVKEVCQNEFNVTDRRDTIFSGPGTWGPGMGPRDPLACTVCIHTVASSLGEYPGPRRFRVWVCVSNRSTGI